MMTETIRTLMNGKAELAKINADAEAKREALRRELENAVAARRSEIALIVEAAGALTLPDDVIGGALLVVADHYRADPQAVQKYQDAFAARFPGAAKKKRGRRPRALAQGDDTGAQAGQAHATAEIGQQASAE